MNSCKIAVFENYFPGYRTIHQNHVDYAIGNTCFFEYLHEDIGRIYLCIGRFPHHYVAHECRGSGQIAGNGREIEGR